MMSKSTEKWEERVRFHEKSDRFHTYTEDGKLFKYDMAHVNTVASLFRLTGTAFASCTLWLHVLLNISIGILVCAAVLLLCRSPELIDVQKVGHVVWYMSAFVAFILCFYLTNAVSRWWAIRSYMLGGLRGAVNDLSHLLAVHLGQPENRTLQALVLRYSLASFELTFMQGSGIDGDLLELVRKGLLKHDEAGKLQPLPSKSQVVWVWIAGIFQGLAQQGKISSRLLIQIYDTCSTARRSISGVFAYVDTQLPYAYVHLVGATVHLNNFLVATKCGVMSAIAINNLMRHEHNIPISDAENVQVLCLQIITLIVVPLLYHALLMEAAALSDPFVEQGFPGTAYRCFMRDECKGFQQAGEDLPPEVVSTTLLVESEETFIHDVVVVA
eukprot:gnl/MRDRNA2_/MRDRNA2_58169_c0_seq1.p1 gnl/MRDRNA2_/MRDRNA2_58169_c0~~gnl/MRDRNA2_/MRDRNA2_58169_c0_seq1.p1  ORF type:complete len:385 (-),score=59.34 gnl/MRDRNA2_/MRDRNA2_58169_c0_seq1:69-1223(-)